MTPPIPPALLNSFATGLSQAFSNAAKGLNAESERFIATRPYEKILCGFLTPSGEDLAEGSSGEVRFDAPELPVDQAFEQSTVGLEWSAPESALADASLEIDIGLGIYCRIVPDEHIARTNASFDRRGRSPLIEVWERRRLASLNDAPLHETIDLRNLNGDGSLRVSLAAKLGERCRTLVTNSTALFRGAREVYVTQADLTDAASYSAAVTAQLGSREASLAAWHPAIDVRVLPAPAEPGCVHVLVRLVNLSPRATRQQAAFVDPRLYAVDMRVSFTRDAHACTEFRVLPNSYRYDRRVMAVGINCNPVATLEGERVVLRTESIPIRQSPRIVPREIRDGAPLFSVLANSNDAGPRLRAILEAMGDYNANAWASKLLELTHPAEIEDASNDRRSFADEIRRFEHGIVLLEQHRNGPIGQAFALMNETMRRLGERRRRSFDRWHLFQVVFIVSMLPELVKTAEERENVDRMLNLLWFPAGGGKTEAFLGLLLWHLFYDRLRGKTLGTTAFLRYPLRLLTYQQLQRLCHALGCADGVRLDNNITGEPFSLGYLVGESTTPNSINDERHTQLVAGGIPKDWQRVFQCPACSERTVALKYNADLRLVEHYCKNPLCRTQGARLQVYIVDDDLYRYLPSVIVSTVDKLAGLGQNRRFAQLLGRIEFYCPVHGAGFGGSNRQLCSVSRERVRGVRVESCEGHPVLWGPFASLAPSLHIQDELHLLREALATFDSHYETTALAVQRSVSRDSNGWSLIGSTATIEGYEEQASQLYLAEARRFPAPGPEAYDSFYYHSDAERLGRLYIGVLGVGRTHTPAVARVIYLLYALIERIRQESSTAPEAVNRLLGLTGATTEQLSHLAFLYEVVLTYVLTRKGGDQVGEAIDSRVRSDIESLGGAPLRVESFHSNVDMPHMIATMEAIESASPASALGERIRGVLATNIISHGVDIDRFNVMVFAGFPKHVAEYIQASARVGRQWPAIAVLVSTPQAARDRSVLDRFDKFHQYVDRLVEPVPINRWSEPALEMSLPGVLAAYLMGVVPTMVGQEIYLVGHVATRFGQLGMHALDESAVVSWVADAVGATAPDAPATFSSAARVLAARIYGRVTGAGEDRHNEPLNTYLQAMRSLRDVDDPAWIRPTADAAAALRRLGA